MTQVTARLPDKLIKSLDRTADKLKRTRAEVIRQALEYYLEDVEDLSRGLDALRDPAPDPQGLPREEPSVVPQPLRSGRWRTGDGGHAV